MLWVTSGYTKIDSTLVALIGIVVLLHMGTIHWKDVANNTNAVSFYCYYVNLQINICIYRLVGNLILAWWFCYNSYSAF